MHDPDTGTPNDPDEGEPTAEHDTVPASVAAPTASEIADAVVERLKGGPEPADDPADGEHSHPDTTPEEPEGE